MPSSWLVIDSDFPTFSKETPMNEQVSELQEYMYVLIEQLRYQLSNLNANNWNSTAMKQFQEDTTRYLAAELAEVAEQLADAVASLEDLTGRVAELENRAEQAETDIAYIQQEQEEQNRELERLDGLLTDAEADIDALNQEQQEQAETLAKVREDVDRLAGAVNPDDEAISIGDGVRPIRLVGEIYINGVKLEVGESNETA